ncbi:DUF423 domain-containing protein [bacterium CG17_big_fil_post_rev_8_21_14_2_50_64_8]|nr:MAG: DUF423 domain-containing protein [bacterium CG17_big_fil_post_rev_8_21_14_2_50_64_8]PJA73438.1 MAG: DUF423 domain-containing protein [bacterium CG_4_9_14_3_um_filter_65_15]
MERVFLITATINGFLAVALGAFGAHGLHKKLAGLPDKALRLDWWETAAHYHLTHALALGMVAYLATRSPGMSATLAGWVMLAGIVLFSGSLYVMTLTENRSLGASLVPLGGTLLLVGWVLAAVAALRVI